MIDRLVDAGVPADRCCRVQGVARQNYYKQKRIPTTPTQLRRQWLTGLIREVHVASRGTYGYRRVHAELTNQILRQTQLLCLLVVPKLCLRSPVRHDEGLTDLLAIVRHSVEDIDLRWVK